MTLNVLGRFGDVSKAEYRPTKDWIEIRCKGATQHFVDVSQSICMIGDQLIFSEHRQQITVERSSLRDARLLVRRLGGSVRRFKWL